MSFPNDILRTIDRVGAELDALGVEWAIGGSIASSMHAQPRSTNDIDFIACLRPGHAARLARALEADFYIHEETVLEAITAQRSFNLIDERTFVKVDVFVPPPGPLGVDQLRRKVEVEIDEGQFCFVLGREDTILQKLRWYELGGRVSDRQWEDIRGLVERREGLDVEYMRAVAKEAGLAELLELALA